MEILAMVISMGCTVGVVAFLAHWQNRPLSDWKVSWLSLTAILSILATLFEFTTLYAVSNAISQCKWAYFKTPSTGAGARARPLSDLDLFDAASRGGPWDSLMMMVKRPTTLASLGALATLLFLPVGTFVQQTLEFTPRDFHISDGQASFPVAHIYNSTAAVIAGLDGGPDIDGNLDSDAQVEGGSDDIAMQGGVYSGLFRLPSPAMFVCGSSNCTWGGASHFSLGFAATCADVTDVTLGPNRDAIWNGTAGTISGTQHGTNVTTPGNITIDAAYSPTSWQPIVIVQSKPLLRGIRDSSTGAIAIPPAIARIAVFRAPLNSQFSLVAKDMEITECDVSLAAYRYSDVAVHNNTLAVGRAEHVPLGLGEYAAAPGDTDTRRDSLYIVWGENKAPAQLPVALRARFLDIKALEQLFLSERFVGAIYGGESPRSPPVGIGDAFRSGSIADTLDRMARSMTEQMRLGAHNLKTPGESIYQVVYIKVRWGWASLPLLVQVLALVFVAWVVVKSNRAAEGMRLWKDSAVAVLMHRLRTARGDDYDVYEEGDVGSRGAYLEAPPFESADDLEEWAEKMETGYGSFAKTPAKTVENQHSTW